jgi:hypothetical protein
MYGIIEGEPFRVYARRDSDGSDSLVIRFECQSGMGVLGIRKTGRTDPAPSTNYEEVDIEPGSLRAGRFVHVLASGQRQSYALSRLSPEVARRLPTDAWVELKPHTEYGFRYLIATEDDLLQGGTAATVSVSASAEADAEETEPAPGTPVKRPKPVASARQAGNPALPQRPTPMSPALADVALAKLDRDGAVEHLRLEMAKVQQLHNRVVELEAALASSREREADLLDVLSRWQQRG